MKYLEILKDELSKKTFVEGLIRLAKADGSICAEEQSYFMSASQGLGLTQESLEEVQGCLVSDAPIPVHFDTKREAVLLIREGIQLCFLDENYDENERSEIRSIAKDLGVSEETVVEIEAWAQEGMDWKYRGDRFLNC